MGVFHIRSLILYEDTDILVCRKPAGLAVQTARLGSMDLENALKTCLETAHPGIVPYLAVIHRLDQPVEGVLIFAKTPAAAKNLNLQMTSGEIGKEYLAVTDHRPKKTEGILEDYLKKDGKTHTSMVVPKTTAGAKYCRLYYRLQEEIRDERVTGGIRYLLRVRLFTGRHHQIRVQMSHAGMPLVGDRKYYPEDRSGLPLGLCSVGLKFHHPVTGDLMNFQIDPQNAPFQ